MTMWDIVGHDWAVQQLQVALDHGDIPQALLITGPENVGKMTLARIVGNALLCKGPVEQRPCGACLACRKFASGNHPDFMLVEPEEQGGNLKIDQIRAVERFLALTPNESAHKIALINAFERATIGAANALLKTLEEPPAYAHLILLAQDADLLLPTIVSRSQQITLRPLSHTIVEEALRARWNVPAEQARHLARISGGRMGWAVRAVTEAEYQQRMDNALLLLLDLLKQDLPSRFDAAQTLTRDPSVRLDETLAYWLTGWRDVVLIQTGNTQRITHQRYHDPLTQIAQQIPLDDAINTLKALETCQDALQHNANAQLWLENLLLNLPALR
ncbi:MAG TPA: DNA polymerase III subunit delta' [Anaerolineae bacterium]|nr:DNA polymerase III subunit delta' [Anaerolineae bacterium]HQI87337.1 DNA polymerase III subunit delta' [Anaerolineae bacterium]